MAIPKDQATSASWIGRPLPVPLVATARARTAGMGGGRSRIPLWLRDSVRPAVRRAALERRRLRGPARLPRAARQHGYGSRGTETHAWDAIKGAVRDAWDASREVFTAAEDEAAARWQEVSGEYRSRWMRRGRGAA